MYFHNAGRVEEFEGQFDGGVGDGVGEKFKGREKVVKISKNERNNS